MRHTASSRQITVALLATLALTAATASSAAAQGAATTADRAGSVVSSQIEISRDAAGLRLELDSGREVEVSLRDDRVWMDGRDLGPAERGEALDRAWRQLLNRAMDEPTERLAALLVEWTAPEGETATRLDAALEDALTGAASAPVAASGEPGWSSDSVAKLNARIAELEDRLREQRSEARQERGEATGALLRPFRNVLRGIAGILSTLAIYAVLVGLGFAAVFFGRRYLEGVADTARHATLRSGLVGLAGSFLVLPAFILGTIALAISIVGIPLLLVWVPLFPLAFALAALFGYLAVGHAAGEALAERRFYGGELFTRANSYYYVLTGVGLLLALFIASQVVQMGGSWFGFLRGLLTFLAVVLTWAASTIGFGAVLLSRGGTRPAVTRPTATSLDMDDVFEEEAHV